AMIDDGAAYDVLIAHGDQSGCGNDPDLLRRWGYAGDSWTDQRMRWKGQDSYDAIQGLIDDALQDTDEAKRQELWNDTCDALTRDPALPARPPQGAHGLERR